MHLIAVLMLIPLICFASFYGYVHYRYQQYVSGLETHFYDEPNKVWSHRGYTGDGAQDNTIDSYTAALHKGAVGIEVDIHFDPDKQQFLVSHASPSKEEGVSHLSLRQLFDHFGDRFFYWLDFKNLHQMKDAEAFAAAQVLIQRIRTAKLAGRVTVESINPAYLGLLKGQGIYLSFWVNLELPKNLFTALRQHIWYRRMVYTHRLHAISMPFERYGDDAQLVFGDIDFYLFTVNDPAALRRFIDMDQVKILLTDTDLFSLKAAAS